MYIIVRGIIYWQHSITTNMSHVLCYDDEKAATSLGNGNVSAPLQSYVTTVIWGPLWTETSLCSA